MFDYEAIIEQLNDDKIKALLDRLDIPYIDKDGYIMCKTACHNIDLEEASYKLYYYKNNHIFVCYTECGNMSIFKFLRHYYETRQIEYDWYRDIYQVILDCSNFTKSDGFAPETYKSMRDKYHIQRKIKQLPEYDAKCLDCFVKYYPPEWLSDGITKAAMDKFDIRYSISQNKIIIPHYDIDNRLVGIRGRALNEWDIEIFGKYMPVQIEQTWYSHPLSMNLYGLNVNKDNIKQERICYLFEAEKSVMQVEGFNMPNCAVAVCGSNFNKYALNILIKYCAPSEIVICFDKEELPGQDKYFNKLYALGEKYKNYCNFSFIYDRSGLLNLKDSPSDHGEEVFKKLLETRVKVR